MSDYTPGFWKWHGGVLRGGRDAEVIIRSVAFAEPHEANKRLIEAAPELADALAECFSVIREHNLWMLFPDDFENEAGNALIQAGKRSVHEIFDLRP